MNHIDLTPLLNYGIEALALVLMALGSWAVVKIAGYFGIKIDDSNRALIEQALQNGINFAKKKAEEEATKYGAVDVKSAVIANASNYVLEHAPEAVYKLKITPAQLADKVEARLPQ